MIAAPRSTAKLVIFREKIMSINKAICAKVVTRVRTKPG